MRILLILLLLWAIGGCVKYTPLTAEERNVEFEQDTATAKLRFSFFDKCMRRLDKLPSHVNGADIPKIVEECSHMSYVIINGSKY